MAKETKNTKSKEESFKDKLFQTVGQLLATELNDTVTHLKMKGKPECLIIMDSDNQYTLMITSKKNQLEFDDEHVVNVYEPVYGDV